MVSKKPGKRSWLCPLGASDLRLLRSSSCFTLGTCGAAAKNTVLSSLLTTCDLSVPSSREFAFVFLFICLFFAPLLPLKKQKAAEASSAACWVWLALISTCQGLGDLSWKDLRVGRELWFFF